jgi:hypothetical protein
VLLGSALGVFIALSIEYYFAKKILPKAKKIEPIIVKDDDISNEDLIDIEPKLT